MILHICFSQQAQFIITLKIVKKHVKNLRLREQTQYHEHEINNSNVSTNAVDILIY